MARPRFRLLALLAVRNDLRFLPGYIASIGPEVDGIVALDDGSTDGSAEYLERCDEVIELIRIPPDRPEWDEPGNYLRLVEAGVRHGADWLISVDADERLERHFRARLEWVLARARLIGASALQIRLRELWDSPDRYRVDGIWGRKTRARLFRARPDAAFEERPLHGLKIPMARPGLLRSPLADLELYHLRMVRREDREARRARYELADPDATWQPGIGYAYLTDECDIELEPVASARGFEDRPAPSDAVQPPSA